VRPQGDRRHISVLFFDVVDASALSERLDPEDFRDILQSLHAACETAVRDHGGHVAQRLGDGLLAYFGYPHAFEDSPRRAIQAGLATLRGARERAQQMVPRVGAVVKTRLGIHTGLVVLDDVGPPDRPEILAIGETPNKAARVQAAAKADSLVVSEATYRLTRGFFTFVDLGFERLRGFSHPVRLHAVADETEARSRLDVAGSGELTRFVDRDGPRRFLHDQWEQAQRGRAPVVAISGDAGIGKSRLVRVFRDATEADSGLFITCYCASFFQSTALWPIADMLHRRLSVDGTGTEQKLTRLRTELADLGIATDEIVARIASLLSLAIPQAPQRTMTTAQKERQETFEALFTWMMRLTRIRPVLLLVEDLHWVDPSTLEFLSLVEQRVPAGPLMVVVTHRPEFKLPWSSPRVAPLELGRLDRECAAEMLSSVAGEDALSGDTITKLLDRADGVPLYLEEITKAVIESSGSSSTISAERTEPSVPATLQDSLSARLDRLGSGKVVAQLAATIGRTFDFNLLDTVAGIPPDELRAELDRLVAADMLHRKGAPPNETFIFKHALIQDAAYASLLRRVRQQYHQRIVEALTSRFPEVAKAQPELVAHHYAGAGLPREAIAHWLIAAERAMARSAFSEAIDILSRALADLPRLSTAADRDRTEIELRSALGLALISTKGWAVAEVEDNYARLLRLCESFGSVPAQVLHGQWGVQLVRGDREGTTRLAAMFRALLTQTDDLATQTAGGSALGAFSFYQGDYPTAAERFAETRALVRRSRNSLEELKTGTQAYGLDAYIHAEFFYSLSLQFMGSLNDAQASWTEALSWLETTHHPFLIATALAYGVAITHLEEAVDQTAALAARLVPLCVENQFHYWLAIARCGAGWASARQSEGRKGLADIEQGLATLKHLGAFIVYPFFAGFLAEAQLLAGDFERASQTIDDTLSIIRDRFPQNQVPRLLYFRGQVEERRGNFETARRAYEVSIDQAAAGGNVLDAIDSAHRLGTIVTSAEDMAAVSRRLSALLHRSPDGLTHPRFATARRWLAEHS
jgi:class 3 adenylate cyclase/tetratricopeptide (TPR) repeat protein